MCVYTQMYVYFGRQEGQWLVPKQTENIAPPTYMLTVYMALAHLQLTAYMPLPLHAPPITCPLLVVLSGLSTNTHLLDHNHSHLQLCEFCSHLCGPLDLLGGYHQVLHHQQQLKLLVLQGIEGICQREPDLRGVMGEVKVRGENNLTIMLSLG